MKMEHIITQLLTALLVLVACTAFAAPQPMNVIFILADDLGYSDTTLYGTTKLYQTPSAASLRSAATKED